MEWSLRGFSQFEFAVVAILFLLVVFRVALITIVGVLIIRPVRDCPACFQPTVPIRVPWLERLSSGFEWRWCPQCRWEGLARRRARQQVTPPGRTIQI